MDHDQIKEGIKKGDIVVIYKGKKVELAELNFKMVVMCLIIIKTSQSA